MITAPKTIDIVNEHLPCSCCKGTGKVLNSDYAATRMSAYRTKREVSLRAVARKMGLSPGYLSDLENGNRGWTQERVDAFKAAVDSLLKPKKGSKK